MRTSKKSFGLGIAVATSAALLMPAAVATSTATAATSTPVTGTVAPATAPAAPAKPKLTKAQIRVAKKRARARAKHLRAVSTRKRLVRFAKTRLHHRGQYVAGASSSWRFDCSGFTKMVYKRVTGINLPHYSGSQWRVKRAQKVSKRHLLPGDLLVWGPGGSQHVSMYIGHSKMIGANNPRSDVSINRINDSYWRPRYAGAARLIKG
ncbi:MAG: C40 family peptidase [Candidatus Nanopelagicales bacterium]